jgi:hypothetical protein
MSLANDPRYPIGRFDAPDSSQDVDRWIETISLAPGELRRAVDGLGDVQLDTPYRDGGWTVRQVAHHIPDSHMNGYIRLKLALTEESPAIRPYMEDRWAELEEAKNAPVEMSLRLLEALHVRWVAALRALDAADLERTYQHPDMGTILLFQSIANYAWHGRHHIAHITSVRERMKWV